MLYCTNVLWLCKEGVVNDVHVVDGIGNIVAVVVVVHDDTVVDGADMLVKLCWNWNFEKMWVEWLSEGVEKWLIEGLSPLKNQSQKKSLFLTFSKIFQK